MRGTVFIKGVPALVGTLVLAGIEGLLHLVYTVAALE